MSESPAARSSVPFDAADGLAGPPDLDEQAVTGLGQLGHDHFVELAAEQLPGSLALQVADEHGAPGDLRFADPSRVSPSGGSTVGPCSANRGSRSRSAPLRASGIEPNRSSPSSNTPRCRRSAATRRRATWRSSCASALEQRPHPGRERRLLPLEVTPCRHRPACSTTTCRERTAVCRLSRRATQHLCETAVDAGAQERDERPAPRNVPVAGSSSISKRQLVGEQPRSTTTPPSASCAAMAASAGSTMVESTVRGTSIERSPRARHRPASVPCSQCVVPRPFVDGQEVLERCRAATRRAARPPSAARGRPAARTTPRRRPPAPTLGAHRRHEVLPDEVEDHLDVLDAREHRQDGVLVREHEMTGRTRRRRGSRGVTSTAKPYPGASPAPRAAGRRS